VLSSEAEGQLRVLWAQMFGGTGTQFYPLALQLSEGAHKDCCWDWARTQHA
jgi:hypothetical protein